MIRGIKKIGLQKAIKEHNNSNYIPPTGINEAQRILIIAKFEDRKEVDRYVADLRLIGRQPKILYFGEGIRDPDNNTYSSEEVNWAGVPQSGNVEKRLASKYDLCIFLIQEDQPHYHYILALTKAALKVGPYVDGLNEYFDLIIDIPKKSDAHFLINEVKRNLSLLSIN